MSSLSELFSALSNEKDEIRSQAESFVLETLSEKNVDFIDKVLDELISTKPAVKQAWYSFIIISKCVSFYENCQKIFDASLLFFGNENEQLRLISVFSYFIFSTKAFKTNGDQASIQFLLTIINQSTDFNTIESTIRCISSIMKKIPRQMDIFNELCDYLFNFFLQSETVEVDTLLILAINEIIPLISESYLTNGQLLQKLIFLIDINDIKEQVYKLLEKIADYFYSSMCLSEVISRIIEVSCHDLSELNDSKIVMSAISFWSKIAKIELDGFENELNFHYVNLCGESLTPFLIEVMSKKYDDDDETVEQKTDWKPLQASRETLELFCSISFQLISPILYQFIDESSDAESVFFIVSILVKTMPIKDNKYSSQIPTFLNNIFPEMVSSNDRVRYSAFFALQAIVSLDSTQPQQFEPFLEIFPNEWTDIEQNACKSFEIFSQICAKMPFEKEAELIIQAIENIENMPVQYISFFLDYIQENNFKKIDTKNSELIIHLIAFFSSFLEESMNELNNYSIVESTISVIRIFFIPNLDLSSVFTDLLNLLMKAFSEHTIPYIPLAISYLFQSDTEASLPHLPSIVDFFISLLNNSESLTSPLIKEIASALLLMIYIDFNNEKMINDVFECFYKLLLKSCKESHDDANIFLIFVIFEFFDVIFIVKEPDPDNIKALFNLVHKYFSLSESEIHNVIEDCTLFYDQIIEFITNLISSYPQIINFEYFDISCLACKVIKLLSYKTKEICMKNKKLVKTLLNFSAQFFNEEYNKNLSIFLNPSDECSNDEYNKLLLAISYSLDQNPENEYKEDVKVLLDIFLQYHDIPDLQSDSEFD